MYARKCLSSNFGAVVMFRWRRSPSIYHSNFNNKAYQFVAAAALRRDAPHAGPLGRAMCKLIECHVGIADLIV